MTDRTVEEPRSAKRLRTESPRRDDADGENWTGGGDRADSRMCRIGKEYQASVSETTTGKLTMEPRTDIVNMTTDVKFPDDQPFSLDGYVDLLIDLGDLTYNPDSSHVPDVSVVAECHDELSTAEVTASTTASLPDEAVLHDRSSTEPCDDTYLDVIGVSEPLIDAEGALNKTAVAVVPEVPAAPAATLVPHQTAGSGQMFGLEDWSTVQAATDVDRHTSVPTTGPEIVSEIMADDVIDLERQIPMVVNDAFSPPTSSSEHMQVDVSGADQQVPSNTGDEEALRGRRRILRSCTQDAIVPGSFLIEE